MEQNLRELLDKIYELEGLVHLAMKREDKSGDFFRLISEKGIMVGKLCEGLSASENKEPIPSSPQLEENFSLSEYTIDDEALETEDKDSLNEPREIKVSKPEAAPRGKLVFTINERFRFRKELFRDSDAEFNNTLALVASMDDFEEAEDYFINEVGFSKHNPIVGEFLEVIKRYFR